MTGDPPISSLNSVYTLLAGSTLPFIGALIAAGIAWAKDLNGSARRIRLIDEAAKRVAFWEAWKASLDSLGQLTEERKQLITVEIVAASGLAEDLRIPKRGRQILVMRILWPKWSTGYFETHFQAFLYKSFVLAATLFLVLWTFGYRTLDLPIKLQELRRTIVWVAIWVLMAIFIRIVAFVAIRYLGPLNERMLAKLNSRAGVDAS